MDSGSVVISPLEIFMLGGMMMWPLLACSFAAMVIGIQKFLFFHDLTRDVRVLKDRVIAAVQDNDIKAAVLICDNSPLLMAPVLKAGLFKYGASREEISRAMEDTARLEVPRMEQGLTALSTIVGVAPLLGFLGTVIGLGSSFHVIQLRAAAMNPASMADIAGGVWQALITTAAGLLVAAPVFLAYNYFVSCAEGATHEMERAAAALVDAMTGLTKDRSDQEEGGV